MSARPSRVNAELRRLTPGYLWLLALSCLNPLLYLAVPIYTMQISERVAMSRSETTLWTIFAITVLILAVFGALILLREETLRRIGVAFDGRMTTAVFEAMHRGAVTAGVKNAQALRDLTSVRDFISGSFITACLDAFWSPLLVVAMFLVHPLLGVLALALTVKSAVLAWLLNRSTFEVGRRHQRAALEEQEFGAAIWRNTESVRALGMLSRLRDLWSAQHEATLGWQSAVAARGRPIVAVVRFFAIAQPVIVYTAGALLYLNDQLSLSAMMVASLIMMRASAPVEHVVSSWRLVPAYRAARDRLDAVLLGEAKAERMALPRPSGSLVVSRVIATPPESEKISLNDVSFAVAPGRVLGVLGSSGAGKSSLSRLLVGIWRPRHGSIVIGDHDISHWDSEVLGRHIGFMPQDIELLPGTLGQNIARFEPDSAETTDALLEAVRVAGLTDIVRSLPGGLSTVVGPGGFVPSGGQRQRIALARAIYGGPYLVVLDEPNSNLDATGEAALTSAILRMRELGSIVVVVTHKMNLLTVCDDLLVLSNGIVQGFGARAQILDRLPKRRGQPGTALVEVHSGGKE